jgi:ketosteroid isomerase-like protein
MSTTTSPSFDLVLLTRAIERRDAATQASMYADDAIVTIVDPTAPPSTPRVVSGREEIRALLEDLTSRDMSHRVGHTVHDHTGAAVLVSCRYPDGTQVQASNVLELAGGQITRHSITQIWDA